MQASEVRDIDSRSVNVAKPNDTVKCVSCTPVEVLQRINTDNSDLFAGLARGILVMVIVARTALMIPRPGSAALAAAEVAARMKGWDNTTATVLHGLFAFFFTEILLGVFLVYHATRLHARVRFYAKPSACYLFSTSICGSTQPCAKAKRELPQDSWMCSNALALSHRRQSLPKGPLMLAMQS